MAWMKADLEILKQQAADYQLFKIVNLVEYVEQLIGLLHARDLVIKDLQYELEMLKMSRMEVPADEEEDDDGPSTPAICVPPAPDGGCSDHCVAPGGGSVPESVNAR